MKLKNLVLVLLFCSFAATSSGQAFGPPLTSWFWSFRYKNHIKMGLSRFGQRLYLGGGIASMPVTVNQHYWEDAYDQRLLNNYNSALVSPSVILGSYIPCVRLGSGSFGLDVAFCANLYSYNIGVIRFTPATYVDVTGSCTQMMMPLTFAFKTGTDAHIDKRYGRLYGGGKASFGFGIGVAPGFATTNIFTAKSGFAARQFAMIEGGLKTGLAWKVRATVYFGTTQLTGNEETYVAIVPGFKGNPIGKLTNEVNGQMGFQLNVSVLPFSPLWKKDMFY